LTTPKPFKSLNKFIEKGETTEGNAYDGSGRELPSWQAACELFSALAELYAQPNSRRAVDPDAQKTGTSL
jgi:hypothetical protein